MCATPVETRANQYLLNCPRSSTLRDMIYTIFALARQNMRSGKAGVLVNSLLESHIASVILNQKSNLIGCRQHGVAAKGNAILDKTHSCVNSGSQYRTSGVFFRRLPCCDCHCCHAILLLLVMNNSTCVYFCLLSVMKFEVQVLEN